MLVNKPTALTCEACQTLRPEAKKLCDTIGSDVAGAASSFVDPNTLGPAKDEQKIDRGERTEAYDLKPEHFRKCPRCGSIGLRNYLCKSDQCIDFRGVKSELDHTVQAFKHTELLEKDEFVRCKEQLAKYKTTHALTKTAEEMAIYVNACSQPMSIRKEEVKQ